MRNKGGKTFIKATLLISVILILLTTVAWAQFEPVVIKENKTGEFLPAGKDQDDNPHNRAPLYECPDYAIFGQPRHLPQDDWLGLTSDSYSNMHHLVYDNFADAGLIRGIHFWGLNAHFDEFWEICYESPMTFRIMFYADNNHFPGDTLATYIVSSEGVPAGAFFNGGYQLYEYYVELNPAIDLNEGWISIQAISTPTTCWFIWMSGTSGMDQYCYQFNSYAYLGYHYDRAFCLLGPESPMECGDLTLFSQSPDLPKSTWRTWAINSDLPRSAEIAIYDNFENSSGANHISFWGLCGYDEESRAWQPCLQSPLNFEINFWSDDLSTPGDLVSSYNLPLEGSPTGVIYNYDFELYHFEAFLSPAPNLEQGWISIEGTDQGGCQLLWLSSAAGLDQLSYQWDGTVYQEIDYDLSFCMDFVPYTCGDVNDDSNVNILDIVFIINFKYKGGPPPELLMTSDVNNDGDINILDIVYLINFKYKGGPALDCP